MELKKVAKLEVLSQSFKAGSLLLWLLSLLPNPHRWCLKITDLRWRQFPSIQVLHMVTNRAYIYMVIYFSDWWSYKILNGKMKWECVMTLPHKKASTHFKCPFHTLFAVTAVVSQLHICTHTIWLFVDYLARRNSLYLVSFFKYIFKFVSFFDFIFFESCTSWSKEVAEDGAAFYDETHPPVTDEEGKLGLFI